MITNIHKNCMGTTSFNLKIGAMRKAQDFIVYPMHEGGDSQTITIQSDTRIGILDLSTGKGKMSQPHQSGAYFPHLQIDKLVEFELSPFDLQSLKLFIFTTAGKAVGDNAIHMVTDNSNAINVL